VEQASSSRRRYAVRNGEHERIPEASDTSGWEIAADAVVVQVEAGLQEYRRMYGPKFARKAIGFPTWLFQLGKKAGRFLRRACGRY